MRACRGDGRDRLFLRIDRILKEEIQTRAAGSGMTVSAYIRHSVRALMMLEDLGAGDFVKHLSRFAREGLASEGVPVIGDRRGLVRSLQGKRGTGPP